MAVQPFAAAKPVVEEGRNCWRIARAGRVSVVIDAADYFHYVRELCEAAQNLLLFIGWDFDSRISLEPGERSRRARLSGFFLRLARRNPRRRIAILKWRFGALKQFLNPTSAWTLARWAATHGLSNRWPGPAGRLKHWRCTAAT